jgi:hypothetical protein
MLATYVYSHSNICNIPIYFCNIHMKHLQHTYETPETLETYACNTRLQHPRKEGRARCSRSLKNPAPGLATPDLMISWVEVERRGYAGADNSHDLLVGNGYVSSTSTRWGTGHSAQGRGRARHARRSGRAEGWSTARRQMWCGSTRDGGAAERRLGAGGVTPRVLWLLINLSCQHIASQSIHDQVNPVMH